MILSDSSIRLEAEIGARYPDRRDSLKIEPWDPKNIQPASYELTLGRDFLISDFNGPAYVDSLQPSDHLFERVHVPEGEGLMLDPDSFALATTVEKITVPSDTVARVEGKSGLGRLGLAVHITAGFIDPGFSGQITFEMKVLAPWSIILHPGMKIAQIAFERLDRPCTAPYGSPGLGSHYQGQSGPTAP